MKKTFSKHRRLVLGSETLRIIRGGSNGPLPPSSEAASEHVCCSDHCTETCGDPTGGSFNTGFAAGCETIRSQ